MDLPIPKPGQDERRPTPHAQGDVHPSVAVYHGEHGGRLLRHPRGCSRDSTATLSSWHLDNAAKAIGFAVLFDGLDGRVARMTGTSSEFGKELDSLADVITFGVAPAMLAWTWGFHLMPPVALTEWEWKLKLTQLGAIAAFLFLMAGASRLARFNITSQPGAFQSRTAGEEVLSWECQFPRAPE